MLAGESVRKASSANRRVYALREDGRTSLATNAGSQPSVSEYIHPTQYPSIRTDPSRRPFPPPLQRQPIPRLSVYTHRDCYFEGERRVFGVVDTNLRLWLYTTASFRILSRDADKCGILIFLGKIRYPSTDRNHSLLSGFISIFRLRLRYLAPILPKYMVYLLESWITSLLKLPLDPNSLKIAIDFFPRTKTDVGYWEAL